MAKTGAGVVGGFEVDFVVDGAAVAAAFVEHGEGGGEGRGGREGAGSG